METDRLGSKVLLDDVFGGLPLWSVVKNLASSNAGVWVQPLAAEL